MERRNMPPHGPELNGYLCKPAHRQPPRPAAPVTRSWWLDLNRDQFAARLKEKRS
jgi:hypothetical protein